MMMMMMKKKKKKRKRKKKKKKKKMRTKMESEKKKKMKIERGTEMKISEASGEEVIPNKRQGPRSNFEIGGGHHW